MVRGQKSMVKSIPGVSGSDVIIVLLCLLVVKINNCQYCSKVFKDANELKSHECTLLYADSFATCATNNLPNAVT